VAWRHGYSFETGLELLEGEAAGTPAWFDASLYSEGAQIHVRLTPL